MNYRGIRENIPQFKTVRDNIDNFGIPNGALLYGMLAEYASICVMPDEEKAYSDKFERIMYGIERIGRIRRMPYGN